MKLTAARREHVAGAYALGTLRGPARAWVERRLRHDALLCAEIVDWQDQLARWVEQLAPVAPRDEVWHALERRIVSPLGAPAAETAREPAAEAVTVLNPATPLRVAAADRMEEALRFWRRTASFALAATLALAVGLGWTLLPRPGPTHTAVFADALGHPVWVVDARLPAGTMHIRALPLAVPPPGKSYELWMLPTGGAPVSLGLLPGAGEVDLELGPDLPGRLMTAGGIAVSIEPAGGSPTGQPTGPVVYKAFLTRTAG